jgi:hypothetical protein
MPHPGACFPVIYLASALRAHLFQSESVSNTAASGVSASCNRFYPFVTEKIHSSTFSAPSLNAGLRCGMDIFDIIILD